MQGLKQLFNKPDKGFLRSSLSILNQDLIVSGLSFISNIIFARWLGPTQLGLFYVIGLIASYSEKFGRLGGLDLAAIYYLGKKKYHPGEIAGHLLWMSLGLSFLPLILYALFQDSFKLYFLKSSVVPDSYIWTVTASIPFSFLLLSTNKILFGLNQIREYSFIQVGKSLLMVLMALFFWVRQWDLFGLCLLTLIGTALPALAAIALAKTGPLLLKPNKALIKDFIGYGWRPYLITIVTFLHYRADLLIVSLFLTAADVTFYSLAVTGAQIIWKIPNSVSALLFVKVASEQKDRAFVLTAEAVRLSLLTTLAASILAAGVIYPAVVFIYGASFIPLIKPFVYLLPGIVVMSASKLLTDHFYGLGKPSAALWANSICAPLNIGLNIWLIPPFGISAAALVSSLTYTLMAVLLSIGFKREGGKLTDLFLIRKQDFDRFRTLLQFSQTVK